MYIGVGYMGIMPMFNCNSKGISSPKACPLGLYLILKAILKNKPFKGFEWSIPLVRF
jgi:hypothetical protein